MNSLLMVERLVLEALSESKLTFRDLQSSTGIRDLLLSKIAENLVFKKLITKEGDFYDLNRSSKIKYLPTAQSIPAIKVEIKELLSTFVNSYFFEGKKKETVLKVQKIWVSPRDEVIFNSMIYNLQKFVEGLNNQRGKGVKAKVRDKKVIFWGVSSYSRLVE